MNQRVDELAWQAGCNQVSHHDPVRPECNGWIINQETLDRFAQLIVQECVLQCHHNDDMDRIEKHFGVEQ
jgi:hypothetical protein